MSRIISWTDADSFTLKQICKNLGISETELDPITLQPQAKFQADELRTPQARPRKDKNLKKKGNQMGKKRRLSSRFSVEYTLQGCQIKIIKRCSLSSRMKQYKARKNPTTSSMAVVATWTSAHDATFTSSMMSNTSTILIFSHLVSLNYSSIILDHLKSNSNIDLNFFQKYLS